MYIFNDFHCHFVINDCNRRYTLTIAIRISCLLRNPEPNFRVNKT